MISRNTVNKILIIIKFLIFVKCVGFLYGFNPLQKCSIITKENVQPCIYDGPEQKKIFPLTYLPSDHSSEEGSEKGRFRGDLNEENWNNAEKGHIHYVYRNQGPSGSLGVNEFLQPSPSHSSYCKKSDDIKGFHESFLHPSLARHSPLQCGTEDKEIISHIVKKCIPVHHLRHIQYCFCLKVGTPPQTVRPIIDTGSTNTWIVGKDCKSESCNIPESFDSNKSSTFSKIAGDNENIRIRFGTGIIRGVLCSDNIMFDNELLENQIFGMVREEISESKRNVFKTIGFQGIMGLGFPSLAFDHKTSLYDNYSKKINADKIFSIYFSNDDKLSCFMIGGVDKRFYEGDIYMLPIVREYYWETRLNELWVGDNKLCCDEESYVIFDSGTSFNTMPHNEFMEFKKLVSPKSCTVPISEDDLNQFPTITYVFDHGIKVEIKPKEYVFYHKHKCRVSYMQIDVPSSYGRAFILGIHGFMQHFYTVYQRSTETTPAMVGFARSVPSYKIELENKALH